LFEISEKLKSGEYVFLIIDEIETIPDNDLMTRVILLHGHHEKQFIVEYPLIEDIVSMTLHEELEEGMVFEFQKATKLYDYLRMADKKEAYSVPSPPQMEVRNITKKVSEWFNSFKKSIQISIQKQTVTESFWDTKGGTMSPLDSRKWHLAAIVKEDDDIEYDPYWTEE
jgi:hypothetical protein